MIKIKSNKTPKVATYRWSKRSVFLLQSIGPVSSETYNCRGPLSFSSPLNGRVALRSFFSSSKFGTTMAVPVWTAIEFQFVPAHLAAWIRSIMESQRQSTQ